MAEREPDEQLRIIDRTLWVDHGAGSLSALTGELPIWADGWAERIVNAVNTPTPAQVITDPSGLDAPFEQTDYGFKWGAMEVTRRMEIDGRVCISVETTPGRTVTVYASRTGRSLRVFNGRGRELKLETGDTDGQH
jgi:hypothetical protein